MLLFSSFIRASAPHPLLLVGFLLLLLRARDNRIAADAAVADPLDAVIINSPLVSFDDGGDREHYDGSDDDGGATMTATTLRGWQQHRPRHLVEKDGTMPEVVPAVEQRCHNGTLRQLVSNPGFEGKMVPLGRPLPSRVGMWTVVTPANNKTVMTGTTPRRADNASYPGRFGNQQILVKFPATPHSPATNRVAMTAQLAGANRSDVVYEVSADIYWGDLSSSINGNAIVVLWTSFVATSDSPMAGSVGIETLVAPKASNQWIRYRYRFLNPHRIRVPPRSAPTILLALYVPPYSSRITIARIDNVRVTEVCTLKPSPTNNEDLIKMGSFDAVPVGVLEDDDPILDVRHNHPNSSAVATIVQDATNATTRQLNLVLPIGNTNSDYVSVGQILNLTLGTRYQVSSQVRRNSDPTTTAIVNYRIKQVSTGVWLGPVNLYLPPDNKWHTFPYVIGIPESGLYLVNVQLYGFGNRGNLLNVTFDNLSCRAV